MAGRIDPVAREGGLLERLRQQVANWTARMQQRPPTWPPPPAPQAPQLAQQIKAVAAGPGQSGNGDAGTGGHRGSGVNVKV
ncbi:MAG: hypothetical protein HY332_12890 [Chloroflexi bacterium]|nr:hypothetical protein [Chloroflexota bacterium]